MELLAQQFVNGLAVGAIYAVFAMGFGLVFATMNILNVAHGAYATWGALAAFWAFDLLGLPLIVSLVAGVLAAGLLAVAVDQLAFEPLRRRGSGFLGPVITSIGFWIILGQIALITTSARIKTFPRDTLPRGLVNVVGIQVPSRQLISIVVALAVMALLFVYVHRTNAGASMRAVGIDGGSASLSGVNAHWVIIQTAFLAGATAGLAGVLLGMSTNNITFFLGEGLLLKGFAAVIVGGFGDIRGAALGGFVIGMAEVMGAAYISNSFRDAITFGLLVAFLVFRPHGILGTSEVKIRS